MILLMLVTTNFYWLIESHSKTTYVNMTFGLPCYFSRLFSNWEDKHWKSSTFHWRMNTTTCRVVTAVISVNLNYKWVSHLSNDVPNLLDDVYCIIILIKYIDVMNFFISPSNLEIKLMTENFYGETNNLEL